MVDFRDVRAAVERLRRVAHRAPVVAPKLLDEACKCRVRLKYENLQRAGAFKFQECPRFPLAPPEVNEYIPRVDSLAAARRCVPVRLRQPEVM